MTDHPHLSWPAQRALPERHWVKAQLLFDPPGHKRLDDEDDEIIDRALAVQCLSGQAVTLLTYDTRQSFSARVADLKVVKLTRPLGEEPPREPETRRAKRRQQ